MFTKREALNRETHAQLRFEPNIGYRFAANLMTVPVVSGEVKEVARDYVLIFDKEQPILHALLGVEANHNAYVNEKGQWLGRYRPAYIRAYPFAVIPTPNTSVNEDGSRQYTVIIDPDAPQFQDREGEPFFDGDGKPTALVEKVQKVLMSLERDNQKTQQIIKQLDEAGLLVERHIELKGRDKGLTGFRVVDTQALAALSGEDLTKLRNTGALMIAYAQMISLTNLRDSPVAWSGTGPGTETAAAPDRKLRSLFEDDEDIDLGFLN